MKVRCNHCDWRGAHDPSHTAADPADPENEISICPACKRVDSLKVVCDEPGCWEPVAVIGDHSGCVAHIPRDEFERHFFRTGRFGLSSYY